MTYCGEIVAASFNRGALKGSINLTSLTVLDEEAHRFFISVTPRIIDMLKGHQPLDILELSVVYTKTKKGNVEVMNIVSKGGNYESR